MTKNSSTSVSRLSIVIFILGLALQLYWHGLLLRQVYNAGDFLKDIDFRIMYTGGQIAREGDWHAVYDLQRQLQAQRQITGQPLEIADVLPFNHPPLLLPLQRLVALADYRAAYLLWAALIALVSLLNAWLVYRLVRRAGWAGVPAGFFAAQSFLFYPIFVSLNKGQDSIFALIGLSVLLLGLQAERQWLAGLGLAVLTLRPQMALPLAVPFLFKQRKIWWWFAGFALVLVIYSALMVGLRGVTDFLTMLTLSTRGEEVLIHHIDMYNLKGLLLRLFPTLEISTASNISWAAFLLTLGFLCWLWARSERVQFQHISLAVTLGLFTSPHLHYHDLSFLFISSLALYLVFTAHKAITPWQAALLLLAESIYLAIIQITPVKYPGVYLLMLVLVILAGVANRLPETSPSARSS